MTQTIPDTPVRPVFIPEVIPGCRCTIEGCLCPVGTAPAKQVRMDRSICDQIATQEDGMCDRCRRHLKYGHR